MRAVELVNGGSVTILLGSEKEFCEGQVQVG